MSLDGRNFMGNCSLSVSGKAFGRILIEENSKKDNESKLGRAMQLYIGKGTCRKWEEGHWKMYKNKEGDYSC